MTNETSVDPIPSAVRELVGLYEDRLGSVEFPGVSASSLNAQIESVMERARELDRALAVVRAAREALEQSQAGLLKSAERGLAYARVFAGDDAELSAALAAVQLSPAETNKPRKRRKSSTKPATKKKPQLALDQVAKDEQPAVAALA